MFALAIADLLITILAALAGFSGMVSAGIAPAGIIFYYCGTIIFGILALAVVVGADTFRPWDQQ